MQLAFGARYRTVRLEINAAFIVLDVEEVDLLHAVVYPYSEVWIGKSLPAASSFVAPRRAVDVDCTLGRGGKR